MTENLQNEPKKSTAACSNPVSSQASLKNSTGTFPPKLGTYKSFALLKISILAVLLTISSYDTIFVKSVEQNYCKNFYDRTKTKILNNKNAALTVEEVWNIIFR